MTERLLRQLYPWITGPQRYTSQVELRYYGGTASAMQTWLGPKFNLQRILLRPQPSDGDLGAKIAEAFRQAFTEGAERVVLVGCDIPMLGSNQVEVWTLKRKHGLISAHAHTACDCAGGFLNPQVGVSDGIGTSSRRGLLPCGSR